MCIFYDMNEVDRKYFKRMTQYLAILVKDGQFPGDVTRYGQSKLHGVYR